MSQNTAPFFSTFRRLAMLGFVLTFVPVALLAGTIANENFVSYAYGKVLGRAPNSTELTFFTSGLDTSSLSRYQVALDLLDTNEYSGLLVGHDYSSFLGRTPTPTELAFGQTFLSSMTPEQFIASLLATNEYFTDAGATNALLIDHYYQNLFGRSPSPSEEALFVTLLGSESRSDVALQLLTSDEYRADLAGAWYSDYLGRSPTSTETAFILGQFSASDTDNQIIAEIIASPEFFNDANPSTSVPEPCTAMLVVVGFGAVLERRQFSDVTPSRKLR